MIPYPHFNPILLDLGLGPLKLRWYGLMYGIGFLCAWSLGIWKIRHISFKRSSSPMSDEDALLYTQTIHTKDQWNQLIFYLVLGVVIGGRLGYILFYMPKAWLMIHPWIVFKLWQGGMSFHGGLLGVIVALALYTRTYRMRFWAVADFIAPFAPIGLAVGRWGNFVNGELWGRVTNMPWAMIFPRAGPLPRHPSSVYELLLEGVVLGLILWQYTKKPRPLGSTSGLFLLLYGFFRIFVECFREPDMQLGFLAWHWLTMGQILSFPMIVLGAGLMMNAYMMNNRSMT